MALWGWGREGRAAWAALRRRLPAVPLTLFCSADEAVDARALGDPLLEARTDGTGDTLGQFDVVVKSPGISPYRDEAIAAARHGTRFLGGTSLWFAEQAGARTLCVTGTKGKSTTSALLAHLLRAAGHRVALTGNIGQPLLELLDVPAEQAPAFWVIELSSYQTRDVAAAGVPPELAIVLNIFPEHLDWHGGEGRYVADKLALVTEAHPRVAVLNAADATLAALDLPASDVRWFNTDAGWHLRGDDVYRGDVFVLDGHATPLPGRHNRSNLCAVLAAIEAMGLDAVALAAHATTFAPLPHRLQVLGEHAGLRYINDSISTTPHASLAALAHHRDERLAIIVGGHDRGLDWEPFASAMRTRAPAAIVTLGQNGARIHDLLAPLAAEGQFRLGAATDLADALAQARALLDGPGTVLLSPGAPSFGLYRDYAERGRDFARLAGFDPDHITSIPGMGIQ